MKRLVLILSFLISPGLFAATVGSADHSDASVSAERKHKKKKKHKPEAAAEIKRNEHSGNAVERAEANANQSMESEMRNNVNAGPSNEVKGNNASTVYPKSASPDVRDSYDTENRTGPVSEHKSTEDQKKIHDSDRSTGSSVRDSMSGSSSLPSDSSQENKD